MSSFALLRGTDRTRDHETQLLSLSVPDLVGSDLLSAACRRRALLALFLHESVRSFF